MAKINKPKAQQITDPENPIVGSKIKNRMAIANGIVENGKTENVSSLSQTIPNQAMSMQEMVNKFIISSEWPKVYPEQYDTPLSVGLPDISQMDKIEIQLLATKAQEDIQKHQAALKMLQEEEFQKVQEENAQLKAAQKAAENAQLKEAQKAANDVNLKVD